MKLHLALRSAAALALMAPAAAAANTLVDTGTPTGATNYTLSPVQDLAAYFSIGSATTITGIQGYIQNFGGGGPITATLYSDGAVPVAANALFSVSFAGPGGEAWTGANGLNWAVGAGNFWLAFESTGIFGMRDGAPSPVVGYAYSYDNGPWVRYDDFDLGIRVFGGAVVPEPGTWALLVLGFGAIGAGMRARRRPQVRVRFAA